MGAAPLILVSNDDGIHSEGIAALAEALRPLGEVVVAAPDRERSAVSHALTLHRPLRVEELGPGRYAIDGTPTDCVNLAINGILKARRPSLVVSRGLDEEERPCDQRPPFCHEVAGFGCHREALLGCLRSPLPPGGFGGSRAVARSASNS